MGGTRDRRTGAAFAATVLIGGANFIAVSVSNRELQPFFGATLRFAIASVLFLGLAWAVGAPRTDRRGFTGAVIYGALGVGAMYALLYLALVGLAAGTAAVIVATAPLFTMAAAASMGQERATTRSVVAGLLAVAGIAVLSAGALGGASGAGYLLAAMLGTIAAAVSSVVARALSSVHPVTLNAVGMVTGTAMLAVASRAAGDAWELPREPATILAVAWLATLGSVGLFQLFLRVIRSWGATAAVFATTAMPVVAVVLGVIVLDQPMTPEVVTGTAMVTGGVYVGVIAPRKGRARST